MHIQMEMLWANNSILCLKYLFIKSNFYLKQFKYVNRELSYFNVTYTFDYYFYNFPRITLIDYADLLRRYPRYIWTKKLIDQGKGFIYLNISLF